jgi:hypothetical protein
MPPSALTSSMFCVKLGGSFRTQRRCSSAWPQAHDPPVQNATPEDYSSRLFQSLSGIKSFVRIETDFTASCLPRRRLIGNADHSIQVDSHADAPILEPVPNREVHQYLLRAYYIRYPASKPASFCNSDRAGSKHRETEFAIVGVTSLVSSQQTSEVSNHPESGSRRGGDCRKDRPSPPAS